MILILKTQDQGVGRSGVWGGLSSWLVDSCLLAVSSLGGERGSGEREIERGASLSSSYKDPNSIMGTPSS